MRCLSDDDDTTTLGSCLLDGRNALCDTSASPNLDCQLLLSFVLQISQARVLSDHSLKINKADRKKFFELVARRQAHEPIAYILGEREFFGLPFFVDKNVLIPRPETEYLVEKALTFLREKKKSPVTLLDLGTGSGCIAISLVSEIKRNKCDIIATASDKSSEALQIARKNAERHSVEPYITYIQGDWFDPLPAGPSFDLIISNPPYIADNDQIDRELAFEPQSALFSDQEGMQDIYKIMDSAAAFLEPQGRLFIECGSYKKKAIDRLIRVYSHCWSIEVEGDLSSDESWRCIVASPAPSL